MVMVFQRIRRVQGFVSRTVKGVLLLRVTGALFVRIQAVLIVRVEGALLVGTTSFLRVSKTGVLLVVKAWSEVTLMVRRTLRRVVGCMVSHNWCIVFSVIVSWGEGGGEWTLVRGRDLAYVADVAVLSWHEDEVEGPTERAGPVRWCCSSNRGGHLLDGWKVYW